MSVIAIVGISVLSAIAWVSGIGFTIRYVDKRTNWEEEGVIMSAIFAWPLILPAVAAFSSHDKFYEWRSKNKKIKELPPIHIKRGAKIQDFEQYKELKKLCTTFEIENGFDKLLEE